MDYHLDIIAIDGPVFSGSFDTVTDMAEKIVHHLGNSFEVGSTYAVSGDGVCTASILGCSWAAVQDAILDRNSQEAQFAGWGS